jgi:glycosyltransferase involved in cell wall biosynthesis
LTVAETTGQLDEGNARAPVLHVISGLMTGGAEKSLLATATVLTKLGVPCSVLTLRSGPVQQELIDAGIPVTEIRPSRIWRVAGLCAALRKSALSVRPGIIHGWMYHGNLVAGTIARALHVPLVIGIRQNLADGQHDKFLTRVAIRACGRLSHRAEATVYNSQTSRNEHLAAGYASANAYVIPNGFATHRFVPDCEGRSRVRQQLEIPKYAFVIGHVARFHSVKNHAMFVRAAGEVLRECSLAHAVMIGKGVSGGDRQISEWVQRTGVSDRFHLLGERHDMPRLYAAMDALCVTSWAESFPNVVGEAMSCGVPCISTDVGDVYELIGDTGSVIPVGEPAPLIKALKSLLAMTTPDRDAISRRCRDRIVCRYSLVGSSRKYDDLYRSVRRTSPTRARP